MTPPPTCCGCWNAADDTLSDLEDMLGAVDMGPADDAAHEKVNARIDKMIAALETARDLTSDEDVQAQLDAAISGLGGAAHRRGRLRHLSGAG